MGSTVQYYGIQVSPCICRGSVLSLSPIDAETKDMGLISYAS